MNDEIFLSPAQAEAVVRVIEAAPLVRRRYQFFVWTQNQLQVLLPHKVAVCGAWQRARRDLGFEVLHSVTLPPEALQWLGDADAPLLRALTAAWLAGRGRAVVVDLAQLDCEPAIVAALGRCGIGELLVHGVSRPQRPAEIETLFAFADPGQPLRPQQLQHLELLLPHLHATYLRVQSTETEMGVPALSRPAAAGRSSAGAAGSGRITERERQILAWVREGKSNQQIGEGLGISALTVKNHVQKILRKLGAANRAQAVAKAMAMNLLLREGGA